MVRDHKRCYIEVDNSGKMTAQQMQAKWKRYEGVDGFILVVAVTLAIRHCQLWAGVGWGSNCCS